MGKGVVSKLLTRIGGEAKIVALHDGGKILDAFFITLAPVRGFERLVVGKSPYFVIEAVMRICGICHAAHAIAAVEAFEDALGIAPPVNGRRVREAIGLLNRVQSHLTHMIMVLPDLVGEDKARSYIKSCIGLLNHVNEALRRIGGAPVHPPNITLGGIASPPTEAGLREALRRLEMLQKQFKSLLEQILSSDPGGKTELLRKHKLPDGVEPLATHPFYGDRYSVDVSRVLAVKYGEYRKVTGDGELGSLASETTSMIALYDGRPVEVGPRARLALFHDLHDRSLLALQLARLIEVELAVERAAELLRQVRPTGSFRRPMPVYSGGSSSGVGVYEAPRGTLIHYVEVNDELRVKEYRIVVPTMFNIPVMEKAMQGAPVELADVIPRLFDPCVPCSTHLVRVGG